MTDLEIIAAFADGERVDSTALMAALAAPDARTYLIDLLALREVVATETMPPVAIRARAPSRAWWSLAAAAVLVAATVGFVAGGRSLPPAANSMAAPAAPVAPSPTRVIQLEPGVSWQERGGN